MKRIIPSLFLMILILLISSSGFSQVIEGTVQSATGEALPGVSVVVEGSQKGTITDPSGSYSIEAGSNETLIFSFIGFTTLSEAINGRSVVNVSLTEDVSQLGEVVVTALGIEKEKRDVGYATSTISADEIVKTASPNFATSLYGKAPGLSIQATPGGATSGVSLNIRGFASITGNTQPLIVVDGVPIRNGEFGNTSYWSDQRIRGNGLSDINPNDIAEVSILKGASAAALYGSEAVNGVMLITTKSGAGKKGLGVDFTTSYTYDQIAYLPRYQNVRGPGYPLSLNDGGQNAEGFITNDDGSRGLLNTSVNFGPVFDGQPVRAWTGETVPYSASNSSYADLFQNAQSSNINLAVTQGGEKANIRVSFTRQDNQMISFRSKNHKNIANINANLNLGKRSKTNLTLSYINQFTKNRPYKVDRMINNFGGMMDRFEQAQWYFDRNTTSLGYRFVTNNGRSLTPDENISGNGFKGSIMDYVYRIDNFNYTERSNRVLATITENFKITESLRLRARFGTDFTAERIEDERPTTRPLAFGNPTGYFAMNNNVFNLAYGDIFLTYEKNLSPDLNMSLLGGYTARQQSDTFIGIGTNGGLSTENLFDISASVNQPRGSNTRNRFVTDAFLGTANFNYKSFLNIEGTVRRDRTSTMAPGNNTFLYPSINSAFVISDAFNLPSAISFSKFRASWGVVGNFPQMYRANVAYNQGTLGTQSEGGQSSLYTNISGNFGNDQIRPEEKHEFEFGLDTRFYNGRFGFDISYYNAQIRDQILPLTIPSSSGARTILTNIGTLRNQGLELSLNANPIRTRDFDWNMTLNVARNVNKVEKLANNSTELLHADFDGNAAQVRSVVGRPMGDIYVHPIATNEAGERIVNPNGLYKIDPDEWIVAGNAMPKAEGGFLNNLSYKNFSLDIVADFRIGGAIMPTGINWMISRGLLEESLNYMDASRGGLSYYVNEDGQGVQTSAAAGPNGETVFNDGMLIEGVTAEGSPNTNVISQARYYNSTYNWGGPQYSSARYELYVKDNTFVKLRELSFGYNLPSGIAKKLKAQNINFSVFGRNLFFFYRNIKDLDPEQTTAGTRWTQNINNAGNNPSFRSMGAMLRASF